MFSLNHKSKINNSYESEISPGSGSSLSENADSHILDDENMQLSYLLKPKVFVEKQETNANEPTKQSIDLHELEPKGDQNICYHSELIVSSQESLKGFEKSPYQLFERINYENEETLLINRNCSKFYDTVVGENSCNAVDIPLSNTMATKQPQKPEIKWTAMKISTQDIVSSSNLSFNGQIERLKVPQDCNFFKVEKIRSENVAKVLETTLNTSRKSPDLFADDSDSETDDQNNFTNALSSCSTYAPKSQLSSARDKVLDGANAPSIVANQTQKLFLESCKRERELLKRVRKCLSGVPPPPSLTIPQLNLLEAVPNRKDEILNFLSDISKNKAADDANSNKSLFKTTHSLEEAKKIGWKDILGVRQHGLHYNITKASENHEHLSLAVVDRFVGAESASSYHNSPSSAKKRSQRLKMLAQSPGNRLSHLAKRRAVFSSANLAAATQKSLGPQVLIDKKKTRNRRKATPKRRTPGSKSKRRKTPSSSGRKRLFRNDLIKPGPSRETSKRALFQSPAKHLQQHSSRSNFNKFPNIKPEVATRVEKSKRALFSPDDNSNLSSSFQSVDTASRAPSQNESLLKRKRDAVTDDDTDDLSLTMQQSKLFRGNAADLTPRALKIKSQSFCIGAGPSTSTPATVVAISRFPANVTMTKHSFISSSNSQLATGSNSTHVHAQGKMPRALSDMSAPSNCLTDNQRKKLLWAVSQALQEKKIGSHHENFRHFATILAKVVKRIFQEFHQKGSTSNSETMLRLAKKYVYHVIAGKSADDVYYLAKRHIEEGIRLSSTRLTGYIGREEFEKIRQLSQSQCSSQRSIHNLFTMDSSVDWSSNMSASQTSSIMCSASVASSQSSCLDRIVEESATVTQSYMMNSQKKSATKQLPIQPSPTLQNSSSKNNLCGMALRENVDCEQRRSAQKNFTGKDQRNMSPYACGASPLRLGSGVKTYMPPISATGAKAKRQISFDS